MTEQLLSAHSIAVRLNKSWDADELARVQSDIDMVVGELEDELNALLFRRQIIQSAEAIPWNLGYSRINIRGPIVRVESLTRDWDGTDVPWLFGNQIGESNDDCVFIDGFNQGNEGNTYTLTYTGGPLNPPVTALKLVRDVMTRNTIVGISVSSGALSSYSVEGMSVTPGAASAKSDANSRGSFSASELGSVARLRRRVVQ